MLSVGSSDGKVVASGSVTLDAGSGGTEGGAVSIAAGSGGLVGGTVSVLGASMTLNADDKTSIRGSNGVGIVTGTTIDGGNAGAVLVQAGTSDSSSGAGVAVAAGDSKLEKGGSLKLFAGRGVTAGGDVDILSGVGSAGIVFVFTMPTVVPRFTFKTGDNVSGSKKST